MKEFVDWLETELFNDWSIAHEFKHVCLLAECPLSSSCCRADTVYNELQSTENPIRHLDGRLKEALKNTSDHPFVDHCEMILFYGGWIDQAVFTLRVVQKSSLDEFPLREFMAHLDRDPIVECGDAVVGFQVFGLDTVFFLEVSRESQVATATIRTDNDEIYARFATQFANLN